MDDPSSSDPVRRPWVEGPDKDLPAESWLTSSDDELLQKIETIDSQHDADERLLEVVASDRHFFIRQEAAKRVRRKKLLFPYEDDRHVGQILVRHLNRREDLTYLERLMARSRHAEVRKAAHVQLIRLRKRLEDQDRREASWQMEGKAAWRVVVAHPDEALRQSVAEALPAPTYEILLLESGGAAVTAVRDFDPHLLLAGIDDLLGAGLYAAIRNRNRPLPVLALCDIASAGRLSEIVGKVADDFMILPLPPGLLAAKARALLYFAHVAPRRTERRKATGPIGEDGILPLFKLCEEEQLTCRLVVVVAGARYFADFVDGEMTEAGGVPALADDEALAAILAVRSGTYEMIEATPVGSEVSPAEAADAPVVQGVVATTPPATVPPVGASAWHVPDDVDATLLGWAVHFIVEQAWAHLGTAATAGLLRRTHHDGLSRHPLLRVFHVEENAHVGVDLSCGPRLPAEAVAVTAQWMAVFLAAARRIAPDVGAIDVRDATKIVGAALEQVDFYSALERAAARKEPKPVSHPIARITPTRRTP